MDRATNLAIDHVSNQSTNQSIFRLLLTRINKIILLFISFQSSGAGGQNVNKRSTCVQLRHVPTGVTVKCQEQRTQEQNRKIARRLLQEQLDIHFNGINSVMMQKKKEHMQKVESSHRKAIARLEIKRAFKARMAQDLDDTLVDSESCSSPEGNLTLLSPPDKPGFPI